MPRPPRAKPPAPATLRAIAAALVKWYRAHRRELPWRETRDPYAIWISEVMLQQTRVAAVIPYWRSWMARFASVEALAAAPLDDVLAQWAGLGYYSRARNLKRGAEQIVAERDGRMPTSAAALRAIPGIGPYTAGAIASIAFDERVPLVDGNVARVFARLFAMEIDIKSAAAQKLLWARSAEVMAALPRAALPGDLNQAIMELGATTCTPTSPKCGICPVARSCQALARELVDQLPIVPRRKRDDELPIMARVALWLRQDDAILFARRHPHGLYGGLWELPQAATEGDARAILAEPTRLGAEIYVHRQTLSHRRLVLSVRGATVRGANLSALPALGKATEYDQLAWLTPQQGRQRGIATSTATVLAHLEGRAI